MFRVRGFKRHEYEIIKGWWDAAGEVAALPGMMPEESTFVVEFDQIPMAAITVYLTNTKEVAYLENLVGNPKFKGPIRRQGVAQLVRYAESFARSLGYKRLLCMSEKGKLKERYQELGYTPTLSDITTMVREI